MSLQRLDAVESRLAALAATSTPGTALTAPDPGSGERWEVGQVWAHLAEFVPYWVEQTQHVVGEGIDGTAVDFGRTKSDAARLGAIERDRTQPISVLWSDTRADIDVLRRFLSGLDAAAWAARGLHPTLGVMSLEQMLDEFLVGHLEQHAEQLEELARASPTRG